MIWNRPITIEGINQTLSNTLCEHLGMEFTEIGDDYLVAKMPVDHRTHQPYGILHGGASAALAETVGSIAGWLAVKDPNKQSVVGLEINANHLKSVREGYVFAKVSPIRIGRKVQVWDIKITNESMIPICVSRLTLAVLDIPS